MTTPPQPEPLPEREREREPEPEETGATVAASAEADKQWLFGGVYGTVLASAVLAALHDAGDDFTPYYDAAWIVITAMTAALAHGYAHHMSAHLEGGYAHRLRQLARALADEWTLVVASFPTVFLLLLAGAAGWHIEPVTWAGLGLNVVLLFGWGLTTAQRAGYRLRSALAIGAADATLGGLIVVANALIK
ncbi:hypothetical protein ABIA32_005820 [Streptacidiphilus sp. MAP12-20]|uniref:hypothetical protein n=1 Tax=Streptacidiphilus sp. MAP12-20 TaxID=3156299 RepID=UPI0035187F60